MPAEPDQQYLPDLSLRQYRQFMQDFPRFRDVVIPNVDSLREVADQLTAGNEFDSDTTGRGDSYRVSQRQVLVRSTGIAALLEIALDGPAADVGPDVRVLDVLGGDGTIARAATAIGLVDAPQWILTGDLSRHMIAEAVRYGLPAVCQPAQRMLLREESFDAVVIAYGSHHIPASERKAAYTEAWRVLKPGGRLVVHDFEQDGPVAVWFGEVVHQHAPNGHSYDHFTRAELDGDLQSVGFSQVGVRELYDPFVVRGESAEDASAGLVNYVADMYGLFGLTSQLRWHERLWSLMSRYMVFDPAVAPVPCVQVRAEGAGYTATMPRVALVGVGTKPA